MHFRLELEKTQGLCTPKSCLHCEDAPCVTACPTGASFKREEDGIVLVNEDWCNWVWFVCLGLSLRRKRNGSRRRVMKKCTLCVDRIYNENLPEEDRVPACVRTCPTNARHFGDLGDPRSDVSLLVAARGGVDLLPEQQTKPVNKYLTPRATPSSRAAPDSLLAIADAATPKVFGNGWIGL